MTYFQPVGSAARRVSARGAQPPPYEGDKTDREGGGADSPVLNMSTPPSSAYKTNITRTVVVTGNVSKLPQLSQLMALRKVWFDFDSLAFFHYHLQCIMAAQLLAVP